MRIIRCGSLMTRPVAFAFAAAAVPRQHCLFTRAHSQCAVPLSAWTTAVRRLPRRPVRPATALPAWRRLRLLHIQAGSALVPHKDKADRGGEDAYFVSKWAAGVFDGVGGWASLGVDPGLYARRLADLARAGIESSGADPQRSIIAILDQAVTSNSVIGSCTACVVALTPDSVTSADGQGRLQCVNLGDSGVRLIRRGQVIYRSKEQQHYFNCPYQLGTRSTDRISDAVIDTVSVEAGDWLVLGTDGLFDNVFDEEIIECMRQWSRERQQAKRGGGNDEGPRAVGATPPMKQSASAALTDAAERVARLAVQCAEDENRVSPFVLSAKEAGYEFFGGKMDDITVVVARIVA